ncbi:MAG: restriction endonuclease subunit S, partial [Pyramidobacter sp.]|nr:restriction endonuclease subunit S [Pyramidobacter sp.]
KSQFNEMFGDPVLNPKGWKLKPLSELGTCKNGMNFHNDDIGVKIHCLGVGDFKDLSVITDTTQLPQVSLKEMPSEEYLLKDSDIVFVRSNGNKALVGRSVAVYPGTIPTTFSGFCIRFRKIDDTLNNSYLLRVLKSESMRKLLSGRGANIQNLNQQLLGSMLVPVPPLQLQKSFADFVQHTDKSKFAIRKSLDQLETLKQSLMQHYFASA